MLGITPCPRKLPSVCRCPKCKAKELNVTDDNTYGVWFFCANCQTHGDPTTFVAKVLNISEKEAAVKLKANGCATAKPEVVDKKLEKMLLYATSQSVLGANESTDLLSQISENYKKGFSFYSMLGKITPVLHKHVFAACMGSDCFDPEKTAKRCRYVPASWESILTIPVFSSGMKITGFCLLGGDIANEKPTWYDHSDYIGLTYHPKLLHSSIKDVMCVQDPMTFLRLCSSWLYFRSSPPPFVLWRTNTSLDAWKQLKSKNVCLVGDSPVDLIKTAARTGAKIKLMQIPHAINKHTIASMHATQSSVSELMSKLTKKYDNAMFNCFVDELKEELGDDISQITSPEYCVFVNRLAADGIDIKPNKRVTLNGKTYKQVSDCWVDTAAETTVSTVSMSIDEVCGYPDGSVAQFGTVSFNDNVVAFEYRGSAFKNHYSDTAKKVVISNGLGIPVVKNKKLFKDIVEAVSNPTYRRAYTDAGWDEATRTMATKRFLISENCGTTVKDIKELSKIKYADLMPTFTVLNNRLSELVSRQNADLFSLWLSFVYNMVAPVFGGTQKSFVCSKKYKKIFSKVAAAVSAKEVEIFDNKLVTKSLWPTTFTPTKHSKSLYINKIVKKQPVIMLLHSSKDLVREHIMPSKIYIKSKPNQLPFSPLLLEGATQSLLEHCVETAYMYEGFSLAVFKKVVASWLSKRNISTKTLYYSFSNFKHSQSRRIAYGVAEAIKQTLTSPGQLQRVPEEFFGDYKYWTDDKHVYMTIKTLEWVLKYATRCDSFSTTSILKTLMRAGVVTQTTTYNTYVCAAFDKKWWLSKIQNTSLKLYNQKSEAS